MVKFIKISSVRGVRYITYFSLLFNVILVTKWYSYTISTTLPISGIVFTATSDDDSSSRSVIEISESKSNIPNDGDDDPIDIGILSSLDETYFRNIQRELDDMIDPQTRCQRYNYAYINNNDDYNSSRTTTMSQQQRRRIFYGSLIADESYELLNIIATETYQIYTGVVFVESNRTQSYIHTRPWKHVSNHRQEMIAALFGIEDVNQVLIKPFINENKDLLELDREQKQRDVIIQGWKELGMQPEDIGIIADVDETFSRDFLRAIQTCSNIPQFQYDQHHCHHESVKIVSKSLVYESSPQCRTDIRTWHHPDMIIGHCIDGIANAEMHPSAPRENENSFVRAPGFGQACSDWYNESKIMNHQYPSWSAADFRRTCGGNQPILVSGYHFHNFFMNMNTTRYKYYSYGHADNKVYQKPIHQMSDDLRLMYKCVNDLPDAKDEQWKRVILDIENQILDPLTEPIYFMDRDYRQRRHEHVKAIVKADDEMLASILGPAAIALPTATPSSATEEQVPQYIQQPYTPYFDTFNDRDESMNATVIAMGINYDLEMYQRFVGSLLYSGYKGHIIVAIGPNADPKIKEYLLEKDVTIKELSWVNCTYMMMDDDNQTSSIEYCVDPYPNIKGRWSRFPLMRDWLKECTTCIGPVLIGDVFDVLFQRNPFGIDAPKVTGLQLYQEHKDLTTQHWLTEWPIRECKGVTYYEPMLFSGVTIGTRETMLEYLAIMYEEMKVWIIDPKCQFKVKNDDLSILNYLYYSGRFPNETTITVPNRMGGIVNTIGYHASNIKNQYISQQSSQKYPGATQTTWIGRNEFGLTNDDGLLVELDGTTVSRVVYQYDQFGIPYRRWLNEQAWIRF